MRNFLWHKSGDQDGVHLANWELVCTLLEFGGLGIKKLKAMNVVLLAKWCWRFGVEYDQLWCQVVIKKYGVPASRWVPDQVKSPHGTCCWKSIASFSSIIIKGSSLKLGSGSDISFWYDIWHGDQPLLQKFPLLHKIDKRRRESFAAHTVVDPSHTSWSFDFSRVLNVAEVLECIEMFSCIGASPPPLFDSLDVKRWVLDSKGSSRSGQGHLASYPSSTFLVNMVREKP
ncbi:hypothetical protein BVC80_917g56 [Macleaya cordata]|uniref:Reverse transcriptase zinc-binding domain n=1 Tax=Macleaya cordata TaxID=56857 RepID=A0A200QJ13_MACCD|nr:hypothetical protein BVC80_917g56 [Macleaya cordata]